jgi:hypothetical protein
MISSSIHLSENSTISFFFIAEKYSIVYIYHIFLIHSSIVGYFHSLPIVNSDAINMGVQVSLLYPDLHSSGHMSMIGMAVRNCSSIFSLLRNLCFPCLVRIYISTNSG